MVKNMSNNEIIPQYDIVRQNYSPEEKIILGEIRENLVDLAISSGESFQPDEEKLLNDIRNYSCGSEMRIKMLMSQDSI